MIQRDSDQFVQLKAHALISLPFPQNFDSIASQASGQNPVKGCGASSSLDITQNGQPRFQSGFLGYSISNGASFGFAFGNDHDPAPFSCAASLFYLLAYPFHVRFFFRNDDFLAAAGKSDFKGNVTAVTPHHLNHEYPFQAGGCIPDFIQGINSDIDCGVGTDRDIDPVEVVVNSGRDSYDRNLVFGSQNMSPGQGAVSSDDDQAIDHVFLNGPYRLFLSGFCEKSFGAGCFEDGPSQVQDPGYRTPVQFDQFSVDQTIIAFDHSHDLYFVIDSRSYRSSQSRVDSRAVSGQNSDLFHGRRLSSLIHHYIQFAARTLIFCSYPNYLLD